MNLEPDFKRMFVKVQHMPNGRTRIFCSFRGAGESVITLEIVGDEDNPKMGHRWYDRVKKFVEYIGRNLGPLVFVWDKFRGM